MGGCGPSKPEVPLPMGDESKVNEGGIFTEGDEGEAESKGGDDVKDWLFDMNEEDEDEKLSFREDSNSIEAPAKCIYMGSATAPIVLAKSDEMKVFMPD